MSAFVHCEISTDGFQFGGCNIVDKFTQVPYARSQILNRICGATEHVVITQGPVGSLVGEEETCGGQLAGLVLEQFVGHEAIVGDDCRGGFTGWTDDNTDRFESFNELINECHDRGERNVKFQRVQYINFLFDDVFS